MNDFFNAGWPMFIAVVTVLSVVACLVLLVVASKRTVMANDNTTGHVWDESLQELNNPLPRWWMWLFVITVLFAAGYLFAYPGLGNYKGSFGWTQEGQWRAEQEKAAAAMAPVYAKFAGLDAAGLAKNSDAMGIGERLFVNNCAQCHGSDGKGSKGFPNLTDGDWLGGSGPEYIRTTITQGRTGMMPPMAAAVGTPEDERNVAHYVLSLSGAPHDNVAAELGKPKFAACAACHGADGKGNQALGAPNLTDKTWLHGFGEQAVLKMIHEGKTNVMPAFGGRLGAEQVNVLAAYVWNLSQRAPAPAAK